MQKSIIQAEPRIKWNYSGKADFLIGTGASRAENWLTWAASLAGFLLYVYWFVIAKYTWSIWQFLLAAIIAADVAGGVVANSLNSCKRFYHTPPKPDEPKYGRYLKNPYFFSALHIYPFLIGLLFGVTNWPYALFWYGALLLSTVAILAIPLYLRRPVAMLIVLLSILGNYYLVAPVVGFEWFIPALFLKIVYGHLVREEPYRPASEIATMNITPE